MYQLQRHYYEKQVVENAQEVLAANTAFMIGYFYAQGNWVHLEEHRQNFDRAANGLYSYIVGERGTIEVGIEGYRDSPDLGSAKQTWEPESATSFDKFRRDFIEVPSFQTVFGRNLSLGHP
jgi:hypothetical protein